MSSEMMQQVLRMIDAEAQLRPAAVDYELAYQARVAIDRIRFVIRQTEEFAPRTAQMREAGLQLLDALDRLQSAERRFQERFRVRSADAKSKREESAEGNSRVQLALEDPPGKSYGHTSAAQT